VSTTNEKDSQYGLIASFLLQMGMVCEEQLKHADRIRRKLATPSSLFNVLKEIGYVSEEMVRKALMGASLNIRIGELLVELGHLSQDDLNVAFRIQQEQYQSLALHSDGVRY